MSLKDSGQIMKELNVLCFKKGFCPIILSIRIKVKGVNARVIIRFASYVGHSNSNVCCASSKRERGRSLK
jgi:hypothetical protein